MPQAIGSGAHPAPLHSLLKEPWRDPWLGLVLGGVLLAFSYGVDNVPIAAWLSPVFLLRFVRTQRWLIAMPVLFAVQLAGAAFQFRGMFPVSGADYWISLVTGTLPTLIPYALDRALIRRAGGIAGILIFPLAWTLVDYLDSFGPFGSWGAAAYSQYGQLSLLQLISVTGLWGITFLIGWFATVCNSILEDGWTSTRVRYAAGLFAAVLSAVLLGGAIRLAAYPPAAATVRIASLSAKDFPSAPGPRVWDRFIAGKVTETDLKQVQDWAKTVDADLLARATVAAQAGARLVFWGEGNAPILKQDEPALLSEGSQLAAQDHIYLGMGIAAFGSGGGKFLENKLVMIDPGGHIAWQYEKAHPVPGDEAAMMVVGDGRMRVLDTPFGRLTGAICFDADYPQTIAQAGVLGAAILLNPSNDWSAIDPWHAEMASFRAIEQGTNVIHQASHGLSAAYDYEGNRLAALDYFRSDDLTMISEVPTKGTRTVYSRFGDWFAWVCGVVLLVLIVSAFRERQPSNA